MGQYSNKGLYNGYKKNQKEREELDYYATPTAEVTNILETLGYDFSGQTTLEPCVGGGHMVAGIQKYLDAHEQNAAAAARDLGLKDKSNICRAARVQGNSAGYHWKYLEEELD